MGKESRVVLRHSKYPTLRGELDAREHNEMTVVHTSSFKFKLLATHRHPRIQ